MANGDNLRLLMEYLTLRWVLGLLAMALPVILVVWGFFLCECIEIQDSISDYYSLRTRDALVGILLALGVFLLTYRGYPRQADDHKFLPSDNIVGRLACVFAVGVAYFPNSGGDWERVVHFISAGGLFVMLAIFSLFLFTKTKMGVPPSPKKKIRNKIYVACGLVIVACIVLMLLNGLVLDDTSLEDLKPVFWLESFALWAFGISWFIKGETLFKDA